MKEMIEIAQYLFLMAVLISMFFWFRYEIEKVKNINKN